MRTDLIDTDGENRAVRSFLMRYSCDRATTIGEMCKHMERSGWSNYWPQWVNLEKGIAHLTKGGAQDWIRHLFGLEATPPAQATAAPTDLSAAIMALQRYNPFAEGARVFHSGGDYVLFEDVLSLLASQPSNVPQGASDGGLADLWIHEDMARDAVGAVASMPRKDLKAAHSAAVEDLLYWRRRALVAESRSAAVPQAVAVPEFTYGHCPSKNQSGGCPHHNLQCGYPECDRRAAKGEAA